MFLEKVDGGFVIEWARHDAPWNCLFYACTEIAQTFCLQLEQTFVAREADIEHALGTIETEAGTLTTCNEECGNLSFAQKNFASFFPEIVTEVVGSEFPRHRREVGRNVVAQTGC